MIFGAKVVLMTKEKASETLVSLAFFTYYLYSHSTVAGGLLVMS